VFPGRAALGAAQAAIAPRWDGSAIAVRAAGATYAAPSPVETAASSRSGTGQ
jgi:hypothetical protein